MRTLLTLAGSLPIPRSRWSRMSANTSAWPMLWPIDLQLPTAYSDPQIPSAPMRLSRLHPLMDNRPDLRGAEELGLLVQGWDRLLLVGKLHVLAGGRTSISAGRSNW